MATLRPSVLRLDFGNQSLLGAVVVAGVDDRVNRLEMLFLVHSVRLFGRLVSESLTLLREQLASVRSRFIGWLPVRPKLRLELGVQENLRLRINVVLVVSGILSVTRSCLGKSKPLKSIRSYALGGRLINSEQQQIMDDDLHLRDGSCETCGCPSGSLCPTWQSLLLPAFQSCSAKELTFWGCCVNFGRASQSCRLLRLCSPSRRAC